MFLKQRARASDTRRGDGDAHGPHGGFVVCGLDFNLLDSGFYPGENGKLWKGFRLNNVGVVCIFLPAVWRVSRSRAKGDAGAPDRGSLPSGQHGVSSQSLEFFPVPLSRNGVRFFKINSLHVLILISFPPLHQGETDKLTVRILCTQEGGGEIQPGSCLAYRESQVYWHGDLSGRSETHV